MLRLAIGLGGAVGQLGTGTAFLANGVGQLIALQVSGNGFVAALDNGLGNRRSARYGNDDGAEIGAASLVRAAARRDTPTLGTAAGYGGWVRRLGTAAGYGGWVRRLGTAAGNERLGTSGWERAVGNERLGTSGWERAAGNERPGTSGRDW
ncbi:hypothetical protein Dsi01nite_048060 [Dactylosporangium siamense]|uniref:Uncharacterized protein n=1 Tax=Dactylosporangium siamense TaxID=685454 RepID=A0A919UCM6_9ACTN|nr:hypothetical protein Dsi01nite_048060 [Dactylosporangium siamense]